MDTKRHEPEKLFPELVRLYQRKYSDLSFDLVIAADDNALRFLFEHRETLFPGVPAVFCGVNSFSRSKLTDAKNMTGIMDRIDIDKTLEAALQLHPDARHLVAVSDSTPTGRSAHRRFVEVAQRRYAHLTHIDLDNLPREELRRRLRMLPQHALVLNLSLFRAADGSRFTARQANRFIADATDAPIYSFWDFMIERGAMGGYVVRGKQHGMEAARIALRVLGGEDPDELPIRIRAADRYLFDYAQLKKRGIPRTRIPANSLIINRPSRFYNEYREIFWAGAATLAILLAAVVVLTINIAQRRRVQHKYRALFESVRDVFAEVSARDGRILEISPSAEQTIGYSPEEITGCTIRDLNASRRDQLAVWRALSHYGRVNDYELELGGRDGRTISLSISAHIRFDRHGNPDRVIGTARDITERKRYARALAERERQYRLLAENVQDMITRHQPDGTITYASPSVRTVLGFTPSEIVGVDPYEYFHPDDHAATRDQHQTLLNDSPAPPVIYRMRRKDGTYVWLETSNKTIRDAKSGEVREIISVSRDVTARKTIEESLRRAKHAAETASREKSEFLANVSHEIRTPLNAVVGFSELLATRTREAVERRYVDSIQESSEHLLQLIDDILDLSKLDAGKLELSPDAVDISRLAEHVLDMFGPRADEKQLSLHLDTPRPGPPTLLLDEPRVRQILVNLVGNAVKFTEQGQVTLAVRVEDVHADRAALVLTVTDTGVGIPEEQRERIFDSFTQGDGSTRRTYGGTGLGLTITQRLVHAMDGFIEVDSSSGSGTTFRVTLPEVSIHPDTHVEEPAPAPRSAEATESLRHRFDPETVVVADPAPSNRAMLSEQLQATGLTVLQAASGTEVESLLEEETVRAVVLDLGLQDPSSYQLAQRIRSAEETQHIPIIALSTSGKPPSDEQRNEFGFSAFLSKPVRAHRLVDAMASLLGGGSTPSPEPRETDAETAGAPQSSSPAVPRPEATRPADSPEELARLLNHELPERWEEVRGLKLFDEIESFAEYLLEIAQANRLAGLERYALELAESSAGVDIDRVDRVLERFPDTIREVRHEAGTDET
jgi:PAS domain S-box-containing protein